MNARRSLAASLLLGSTVLFGSGCVAALWLPAGPPDPLVEVQGMMPGPGHVWVEGFWEWHERWVWHRGEWVAPPRPNSRWARGRWEHGPRGWRYVRGHWE